MFSISASVAAALTSLARRHADRDSRADSLDGVTVDVNLPDGRLTRIFVVG